MLERDSHSLYSVRRNNTNANATLILRPKLKVRFLNGHQHSRLRERDVFRIVWQRGFYVPLTCWMEVEQGLRCWGFVVFYGRNKFRIRWRWNLVVWLCLQIMRICLQNSWFHQYNWIKFSWNMEQLLVGWKVLEAATIKQWKNQNSFVILILHLLYEHNKSFISICHFICCLQDFVGVFSMMKKYCTVLTCKFFSNRNSYKNIEFVERICSIISNCIYSDFRVWTWSYHLWR